MIDKNTRIGHVHLSVADLDRSLDFYCGILGFEISARYGDSAVFVSAGGYHHHIGLNTWQGKNVKPHPQGYAGLFHFAILLPTRKALAKTLKKLIDNKYPIDGSSDHGVSEAIYLRDPDNIGLELYWDRPKSDWPHDSKGKLLMTTMPLNLEGLLTELD